jgi:hypothetical protein
MSKKRNDPEKHYRWYRVEWDTGKTSFEKIHVNQRPDTAYRLILMDEELKEAKAYERKARKIVKVEAATYREYVTDAADRDKKRSNGS